MTERIILEYYVPSNSIEIPVISIAKVVHGYKYIKGAKLFGESGNCNVNINCNEGTNWQDEKTSVALIIVGGTRWCTGSLINNTRADGEPFLLTANHCLNGLDAISNPNASTWTFLWNYESPTCVSGTDFTPPSTSGATVRANNSASDFALLELDEAPFDLTPSLFMYYNGWDKSGSTTSNTTCIHHPSGDIKKISIDNDSPSSNGNYWRVNDWDTGTTEGGSSGSPLFDSNQRVIGQLYGGDAACGNDLYDDFGKLSVSWNNSTDSRRRLKDWLDPAGTNPNTLDGAYLFPTNNSTISGLSLICTSGTFTVNNPPDGTTVTWDESSNLTESPTGTFTANGSGSGWVEATLTTTGCGEVTLPRKTVWVGAPDYNLLGIDLEGGKLLACDYTSATAEYNGTAGIDAFEWYMPDASDWEIDEESGAGPDNKYVEIDYWEDPAPYQEDIYIRAHNTCGWSYWKRTTWSVENNCGGWYMSFSPNPTTGETVLSIEQDNIAGDVTQKSASTETSFDENTEWDMEVYDNLQSLKLKKQKLKGKSTRINTQSWKEGVYMVRVKYNDELLTGKLIVK